MNSLCFCFCSGSWSFPRPYLKLKKWEHTTQDKMQFLFQVAGAVLVAATKIIMYVASDNRYSTKGSCEPSLCGSASLGSSRGKSREVWCLIFDVNKEWCFFWDELGQWGWCVGNVEPKRALESHFCWLGSIVGLTLLRPMHMYWCQWKGKPYESTQSVHCGWAV